MTKWKWGSIGRINPQGLGGVRAAVYGWLCGQITEYYSGPFPCPLTASISQGDASPGNERRVHRGGRTQHRCTYRSRHSPRQARGWQGPFLARGHSETQASAIREHAPPPRASGSPVSHWWVRGERGGDAHSLRLGMTRAPAMPSHCPGSPSGDSVLPRKGKLGFLENLPVPSL